jgi:hypothetical protein
MVPSLGRTAYGSCVAFSGLELLMPGAVNGAKQATASRGEKDGNTKLYLFWGNAKHPPLIHPSSPSFP